MDNFLRNSVVRNNFDFHHFTFTFNSQPPPKRKEKSLRNYRDHILVRYDMRKPNPLRSMSRTRTPNHSILERFLQGTMNLITDILDRRVGANDQGLGEIRILSFPV